MYIIKPSAIKNRNIACIWEKKNSRKYYFVTNEAEALKRKMHPLVDSISIKNTHSVRIKSIQTLTSVTKSILLALLFIFILFY